MTSYVAAVVRPQIYYVLLGLALFMFCSSFSGIVDESQTDLSQVETKILTEIEVSTRIESDICYVVDGFFFPGFPGGRINVRDGVNCAKITVPSGSSLDVIEATSRVLLAAPRNAETRRAQVRGGNVEVVNHGVVDGIAARLPRPSLLLCGP